MDPNIYLIFITISAFPTQGIMYDRDLNHNLSCRMQAIFYKYFYNMGRESSVDTATRYGPDGSGSNPGGRQDIPPPCRPALGPTSLLYNGYRASFPGVKRSGRGFDYPLSSRAEFKERKEVNFYSPSGPS
jgi:hypothetical protein